MPIGTNARHVMITSLEGKFHRSGYYKRQLLVSCQVKMERGGATTCCSATLQRYKVTKADLLEV